MAQAKNRSLLVTDQTPSRSSQISDLSVGDGVHQLFTFSSQSRWAFEVLANDTASIHSSAEFAASLGFDAPILPGLCATSRFSRLIGMYLPGEGAIIESINIKFRRPVYYDQEVRYSVTISRILAALKVVRLTLIAEVCGELSLVGEAQCLICPTT